MCIVWATNDGNRSQHVEVIYQICREAVAKNEVKMIYCPNNEIISDISTNPLGPQKFTWLRNLLPMVNSTKEQEFSKEWSFRQRGELDV